MKKYKTTENRGRPFIRILEYECERETESSVWINGDRRKKITPYEKYFDTWKEAWRYILRLASVDLEECQDRLKKIRAMERPCNGLAEVNV